MIFRVDGQAFALPVAQIKRAAAGSRLWRWNLAGRRAAQPQPTS